MAAVSWRWTPELVAQIPDALKRGGSIMAAAQLLDVSENGLRSIIRTKGIDYRALCASRPLPAQKPAQVPPSEPTPRDPDPAPAWQSYRPRAGWSAPEPVPPAGAAPVEVERVVCIADVHAPHHDRKAVAAALAILREIQPDRVVLLGDFLEVESVSRHAKSRPDLTRLSEEFYAANVLLDEFQNAAPDASWLFLEGNHENRAVKWSNEFGVMDGLMSVPEQLFMTRGQYHRATEQLRGMTWVPLAMQPFVVSGVGYLHGQNESTHHAAFHALYVTARAGVREVVYGHMHAVQQATAMTGARATCAGWLGDPTAAPIRAYVRGAPKPWSHALVTQEICGDLVTTTPIPIHSGRAVWQGARFAA